MAADSNIVVPPCVPAALTELVRAQLVPLKYTQQQIDGLYRVQEYPALVSCVAAFAVALLFIPRAFARTSRANKPFLFSRQLVVIMSLLVAMTSVGISFGLARKPHFVGVDLAAAVNPQLPPGTEPIPEPCRYGLTFRDYTSSGTCKLQGVWIQFFLVSTTLFYCIFAFSVYLQVVHNRSLASVRGWLYAGVLSVATIVSVVPLTADKYGPSPPLWCWLTDVDNGAWQFGFTYSIIGLCVLVSSFAIARTLLEVVRVARTVNKSVRRHLGVHLSMVVFLMVFLANFTYLFFFRVDVQIHDPAYVALLGQSLVGGFFGFQIAVVFLFSSTAQSSARTYWEWIRVNVFRRRPRALSRATMQTLTPLRSARMPLRVRKDGGSLIADEEM